MATQTDPVCGMNVDDQKAAAHSTYEGRNYCFCCAGCKGKFDAKPQQYASTQSAS